MYTITRLANGMRIVTEAMPGFQSAAIGLWVMAGSRHEEANENGIAHFLEHIAFKGTTARSAREIAEAIENVGGYINAFTSREITAYYARVLDRDVPLAVDILADIVLNPLFDPAEIETERHVILQEIGQALDTPDDIIFDWLQEAAYPNQPFGRPILGQAERISALQAEDLRRFVAAHYRPDRMILAGAGAVDHASLVAQAEALFANYPRGSMPNVEPARFTSGERRVVKDLEQVHVALAFEAPPWNDQERYTAQIYAAILGGGMSSRLFQKLREERGLCYTTFAQASAHEDTGMITIYAGTSAEDLTALMWLTIDEIKRLAEDVTEGELIRARNQLKAGLLMGLEGPSGRAERLARMLSICDRVPSVA